MKKNYMVCKDCGSYVEEHLDDRVPCPRCGSKRRVMPSQGNTELPLMGLSPAAITPQSFLGEAKDIIRAIGILKDADEEKLNVPSALLGAHCLEISLKAFLLSRGFDEKALKKLRHNLEKIWAKSIEKGLELGQVPADWCQKLDACHDYPYLLRYPRTNTALVLPSGLAFFK